MSSGFYDRGTDVGDVYVTRDWLTSRYPNLSQDLLVNFQRRIGFAGRGFTGKSPYSLVSTSEQLAPGGTLNENVPQRAWSNFARNATLGIQTDRSLWSWGSNNFGQLGDRTNISRSSPVQVSTGTYWKSVAATTNFSGAIDSSDNLYIWGRLPRVQYSWSTVSAGYRSYAIRNDGTLWEWGALQLVQASSPVQIGSDSNWAKIIAEQTQYDAGVAIKTDGSMWTRGSNALGQLGLNDTSTRSLFTQVGTSSWTSVATGPGRTFSGAFVLAIRNDGALFTWGDNTSGVLGQNDRVHRSSPVQVGTSSWISVATIDAGSAVAVRSDGALFMWGDNAWGQLAQSDRIHRSSPVQVGTSSWTSVAGYGSSSGLGNGLAIRSDGTLWAWGYNSFNVLGTSLLNASIYSRSSIVQVDSGSWSDIKTGGQTVIGKKADGTVWGWGSNFNGQLGPNAVMPALSWTFIAEGGGNFASSNKAKFGITSTGSLYRWGSSLTGSLGLGQSFYAGEGIPSSYDSDSWTAISSTNNGTTLALKSDGSLWSWGSNSNGELGQDNRVHRSVPTQVGTSSWTTISAGENTSAAIRKDGALFVWGDSTYSQIPPRPIMPMSWIAVTAATGGFTFAIRSDYTLWGWGEDITGYGFPSIYLQGVGAHRSSPVQVGTSSWISVAAGYRFGTALAEPTIYAIKPDRTLWFWGAESPFGLSGRNNPGTFVGYSSPVQIGTSSWNSITTNGNTVLAIRIDGGLFGWGRNTYAQIGDSTFAHRSSPVQIGTSSWTQVSIGTLSSFAIRSDGLLCPWGTNLFNGLGFDGSLSLTRPYPDVAGYNHGYSWVAVNADQYNYPNGAGIKTDGSLWTWGYNEHGQLGLNDTVSRSSIVQVGTSSWIAVRAEGRAIRSDGALFAWGFANASQGLNDLIHRSSPTQVGTSSWTALGLFHAIRSDSSLFALGGYNFYGGLGDWTTINRSSPIQLGSQTLTGSVSSPVQVGTSSWTQVLASTTMRAIRSDGGLFVWGSNATGEHGLNDRIQRSSPVQVGTSSWTLVGGAYAGTFPPSGSTYAIRNDGGLFTWGYASTGELGDNTTTHRSSPVQVGTSSWTKVSSGGRNYGLAVRSGGALFAWGLNEIGNLGLNDRLHRSSPVQIGTSSWSQVAAVDRYSYAIRSDGALYGWGTNGSTTNSLGDVFTGHAHRSSPVLLGNGTRLGSVATPLQILNGSWTAIAAGEGTAGFIQSAQIYMMGSNAQGKLGDGTTIHRSSPVQISAPSDSTPQLFAGYGGGNKARQFDLGISHMAVVRSDGTLWTQGLNTSGQLGINNTTDPGAAVQVGTELNWNIVSCGNDHTLAIKIDGTLWGWGINDHGQLGDGTTTHRSSPVQLGTGTNWRYICAGSKMSGALTTDNKLYVWGRNNFGQVGDGTVIHRSSPVQIGTATWTKFVAFNRDDIQSSYAIDIGGELFAWGEDTNNSLGVTSTAHRSSPVQVATAGYGVLDVTSANNSGVGVYVLTDGGNL